MCRTIAALILQSGSKFFTFHYSLSPLERQIISSLSCWCCPCWREWCSWCCLTLRCGLCCGLWYLSGGHGTQHVVASHLVVPATLVLVGVDIKLDGDVLLTLLQGKLLDAILTEDAKAHPLGVHTWHLDDVFLRHPRVACSLTDAALRWQHGDDCSC